MLLPAADAVQILFGSLDVLSKIKLRRRTPDDLELVLRKSFAIGLLRACGPSAALGMRYWKYFANPKFKPGRYLVAKAIDLSLYLASSIFAARVFAVQPRPRACPKDLFLPNR